MISKARLTCEIRLPSELKKTYSRRSSLSVRKWFSTLHGHSFFQNYFFILSYVFFLSSAPKLLCRKPFQKVCGTAKMAKYIIKPSFCTISVTFLSKVQCQDANIKEKESLSSVLFIYSRRTVSVNPAFLLIFVKNYTISLC